MMSVLIGVVSALLIVALVVVVVLRLQCGKHDERRKRHKNGVVSTSNTEHRGSISGPTLSDKTGRYSFSPHLILSPKKKKSLNATGYYKFHLFYRE